MAIVLDGNKVANEIKNGIALEVAAKKIRPCLAVVLVGDDPASQIYVRNKKVDCEQCGFRSIQHTLPYYVKTEDVTRLVMALSYDPNIDGILVQMPLPKHINSRAVINSINTRKDVDCFTHGNVGAIYKGTPYFLPCTPGGIMRLLEHYEINISGKHCVVLGRSNIVGKPMAELALQNNATVTICHSYTQNLSDICKTADILISAVGKRDLIKPNMVKDDVIVIDVGMNRNEVGKLCGDCDPLVYEKSYAYTPVPGGVGPMTRAMLMVNTLNAALLQLKQ